MTLEKENGTNGDLAPWWVKEIRPYGISGMFAAFAVWFGFTVYQNSRDDAKEQAAALRELSEKGQQIVSKNTDAFYSVSKSLDGNNTALLNLSATIRESQREQHAEAQRAR